jgi:ankyrin repeat protein
MKGENEMGKKAICIPILIVCICGGELKAAPPSVALHEAAMQGNLEAIRQHIEAGSDLDERDPMGGASPLAIATVFGQIEVLKALIKAGADVNARNNEGSTPLIIATVFDQIEVSRALIEAGADVNARNNEGSTPLHTAALLCRTEIVEVLLNNGANKNLKNNAGHTALDAVAGSFDDVKDIYDYLGAVVFGPLGLELDYERIKMTRPKIAEMLR